MQRLNMKVALENGAVVNGSQVNFVQSEAGLDGRVWLDLVDLTKLDKYVTYPAGPGQVTYPAHYDPEHGFLHLRRRFALTDVGDSPDMILQRGGNGGAEDEAPRGVARGDRLGRIYWRGYGGDPRSVDPYGANDPGHGGSTAYSFWGPGGEDGSSAEIWAVAREPFTVSRRGADVIIAAREKGKDNVAAQPRFKVWGNGGISMYPSGANLTEDPSVPELQIEFLSNGTWRGRVWKNNVATAWQTIKTFTVPA